MNFVLLNLYNMLNPCTMSSLSPVYKYINNQTCKSFMICYKKKNAIGHKQATSNNNNDNAPPQTYNINVNINNDN